MKPDATHFPSWNRPLAASAQNALKQPSKNIVVPSSGISQSECEVIMLVGLPGEFS